MPIPDDKDLFGASLQTVANGDKAANLGDLGTVDTIIKGAIDELFDELPDDLSSIEAQQLIYTHAIQTMKKFLGGDRRYGVNPGWNKKGVIDVFVAKWCGVDEPLPIQRLAGGFINLVKTLLDISVGAAEAGMLDEQWHWMAEAEVNKFAYILIGVSPVQQALL